MGEGKEEHANRALAAPVGVSASQQGQWGEGYREGWQQEQTTRFPAVVEDLGRFFGRDPDEQAAVSSEGYTFPKFRVTSGKTETLVEQEGKGDQKLSFPISNPLLFNGIYFRNNNESWTTKGRLKAAQLPTVGRIRFVPPHNYKPSNPFRRGPNNGYYDRFDNEWVKGPSRTHGESFEWDVQLSPLGKLHLGWIADGKDHINVSLKGKITHW